MDDEFDDGFDDEFEDDIDEAPLADSMRLHHEAPVPPLSAEPQPSNDTASEQSQWDDEFDDYADAPGPDLNASPPPPDLNAEPDFDESFDDGGQVEPMPMISSLPPPTDAFADGPGQAGTDGPLQSHENAAADDPNESYADSWEGDSGDFDDGPPEAAPSGRARDTTWDAPSADPEPMAAQLSPEPAPAIDSQAPIHDASEAPLAPEGNGEEAEEFEDEAWDEDAWDEGDMGSGHVDTPPEDHPTEERSDPGTTQPVDLPGSVPVHAPHSPIPTNESLHVPARSSKEGPPAPTQQPFASPAPSTPPQKPMSPTARRTPSPSPPSPCLDLNASPSCYDSSTPTYAHVTPSASLVPPEHGGIDSPTPAHTPAHGTPSAHSEQSSLGARLDQAPSFSPPRGGMLDADDELFFGSEASLDLNASPPSRTPTPQPRGKTPSPVVQQGAEPSPAQPSQQPERAPSPSSAQRASSPSRGHALRTPSPHTLRTTTHMSSPLCHESTPSSPPSAHESPSLASPPRLIASPEASPPRNPTAHEATAARGPDTSPPSPPCFISPRSAPQGPAHADKARGSTASVSSSSCFTSPRSPPALRDALPSWNSPKGQAEWNAQGEASLDIDADSLDDTDLLGATPTTPLPALAPDPPTEPLSALREVNPAAYSIPASPSTPLASSPPSSAASVPFDTHSASPLHVHRSLPSSPHPLPLAATTTTGTSSTSPRLSTQRSSSTAVASSHDGSVSTPPTLRPSLQRGPSEAHGLRSADYPLRREPGHAWDSPRPISPSLATASPRTASAPPLTCPSPSRALSASPTVAHAAVAPTKATATATGTAVRAASAPPVETSLGGTDTLSLSPPLSAISPQPRKRRKKRNKTPKPRRITLIERQAYYRGEKYQDPEQFLRPPPHPRSSSGQSIPLGTALVRPLSANASVHAPRVPPLQASFFGTVPQQAPRKGKVHGRTSAPVGGRTATSDQAALYPSALPAPTAGHRPRTAPIASSSTNSASGLRPTLSQRIRTIVQSIRTRTSTLADAIMMQSRATVAAISTDRPTTSTHSRSVSADPTAQLDSAAWFESQESHDHVLLEEAGPAAPKTPTRMTKRQMRRLERRTQREWLRNREKGWDSQVTPLNDRGITPYDSITDIYCSRVETAQFQRQLRRTRPLTREEQHILSLRKRALRQRARMRAGSAPPPETSASRHLEDTESDQAPLSPPPAFEDLSREQGGGAQRSVSPVSLTTSPSPPSSPVQEREREGEQLQGGETTPGSLQAKIVAAHAELRALWTRLIVPVHARHSLDPNATHEQQYQSMQAQILHWSGFAEQLDAALNVIDERDDILQAIKTAKLREPPTPVEEVSALITQFEDLTLRSAAAIQAWKTALPWNRLQFPRGRNYYQKIQDEIHRMKTLYRRLPQAPSPAPTPQPPPTPAPTPQPGHDTPLRASGPKRRPRSPMVAGATFLTELSPSMMSCTTPLRSSGDSLGRVDLTTAAHTTQSAPSPVVNSPFVRSELHAANATLLDALDLGRDAIAPIERRSAAWASRCRDEAALMRVRSAARSNARPRSPQRRWREVG